MRSSIASRRRSPVATGCTATSAPITAPWSIGWSRSSDSAFVPSTNRARSWRASSSAQSPSRSTTCTGDTGGADLLARARATPRSARACRRRWPAARPRRPAARGAARPANSASASSVGTPAPIAATTPSGDPDLLRAVEVAGTAAVVAAPPLRVDRDRHAVGRGGELLDRAAPEHDVGVTDVGGPAAGRAATSAERLHRAGLGPRPVEDDPQLRVALDHVLGPVPADERDVGLVERRRTRRAASRGPGRARRCRPSPTAGAPRTERPAPRMTTCADPDGMKPEILPEADGEPTGLTGRWQCDQPRAARRSATSANDASWRRIRSNSVRARGRLPVRSSRSASAYQSRR